MTNSTGMPPKSICLLRLSALGDCTNIVPIVHSIQKHWPATRIGWVIGKTEAQLVGDLPGVDFYILDKKAGRAGFKALKQQLKGVEFDVLLHMHASWRANWASRFVKAKRRIGFNKQRSRDGQGLFINERIKPATGRHVVNGFMAFLQAVGIEEPEYNWRLPISDADHAKAAELLAGGQPPYLLISPCSSHQALNWPAERYAEVADYAQQEFGLQPVIIGGPSETEKNWAQAIIENMAKNTQATAINLVGKTSLKQLLAVLDRGRVLITPDSGPAHMANGAKNLTTIVLHAATDSRRSGSYLNLKTSVDYFAQATQKYLNATPEETKWGKRITEPDVMTLVPVVAVKQRLDEVVSAVI